MLRPHLLLSALLISLVAACSHSEKSLAKSADSDRPIILITSFEPFGQWKVNLSTEVAREVSRLQDSISPSHEVRLCVLPVEYDRGAQKALECFRALPRKPALMLSMGEGDCTIRLETGVTNLDHTPGFADNAGVIHEKKVILPGQPARTGLSLPVWDMSCKLPAWASKKVVYSMSAGNYVCNNTAYHLARFLDAEPIPYGFIHVPHSGCTPAARDVPENARIIVELLRTALASTSKPRLPSTRQETESLLKLSGQLPNPPADAACYRDFLTQLLAKYKKAPEIF